MFGNKLAVPDATYTVLMVLDNEREIRKNQLLELKAFAGHWLEETGIHDHAYKSIAPFDAAKRECAFKLLEKLENF